MGNIVSAISDDINEYERLCAEYCEPIHMTGRGIPDCYGTHAKELKSRQSLKYLHVSAGDDWSPK